MHAGQTGIIIIIIIIITTMPVCGFSGKSKPCSSW